MKIIGIIYSNKMDRKKIEKEWKRTGKIEKEWKRTGKIEK